MTEPKPSAWLYERGHSGHVHRTRLRDAGIPYYGEGFTETPLYTREAIEVEIVAWLQGKYKEQLSKVKHAKDGGSSAGGPDYDLGRATGYAFAADAIERGEYRSKSDG